MVKRTVVTLVDDIDGSEAVESISFAYRGVNYSIDLNEKNAAAFDKAMGKYLGSAVRDSSPRRATDQRRASSTRRTDLAEVRAWAAQNGYDVSNRGRVAAEVLYAYDAVR